MANITIDLDDDLAVWAEEEAARRGKSLSQLVAEALMEKQALSRQVSPTLEAFLSGPGFPGVATDLPTRDDLYDRPGHGRTAQD